MRNHSWFIDYDDKPFHLRFGRGLILFTDFTDVSTAMTIQNLTKHSTLIATHRFPFNWATPFGYLIALVLEYIFLFCSLLNSVAILCYSIAMPWLLQSCVKDISFEVSYLDVDEILNGNRMEMIDCFRNILQDFTTIKELSEHLVRVGLAS